MGLLYTVQLRLKWFINTIKAHKKINVGVSLKDQKEATPRYTQSFWIQERKHPKVKTFSLDLAFSSFPSTFFFSKKRQLLICDHQIEIWCCECVGWRPFQPFLWWRLSAKVSCLFRSMLHWQNKTIKIVENNLKVLPGSYHPQSILFFNQSMFSLVSCECVLQNDTLLLWKTEFCMMLQFSSDKQRQWKSCSNCELKDQVFLKLIGALLLLWYNWTLTITKLTENYL